MCTQADMQVQPVMVMKLASGHPMRIFDAVEVDEGGVHASVQVIGPSYKSPTNVVWPISASGSMVISMPPNSLAMMVPSILSVRAIIDTSENGANTVAIKGSLVAVASNIMSMSVLNTTRTFFPPGAASSPGV